MNPMQRLLLDLLVQLEAIGDANEELFDSEVRQQMGDAIFYSFVRPRADYVVPDDFGMFTSEGNRRVKAALISYIERARIQALELGLISFHQRLAALQDGSVQISGSTRYDFDDFLGYTSPAAYDDVGNIVNPHAR